MKYYLYRHIRLDKNEVFYIGIGTKSGKFSSYKTEYRRAFCSDKRTEYWKRITEKCDYRIEIIFEADTADEIKKKEIEFIALYKRVQDEGTLCNFTLGGDGTHGFSRTPEINKIIALKKTGVLNHKSKECHKYSSDGNYIESYPSFNFAAKQNGLFKQNLFQARDKNIKSGGYFWSDKKYENILKR